MKENIGLIQIFQNRYNRNKVARSLKEERENLKRFTFRPNDFAFVTRDTSYSSLNNHLNGNGFSIFFQSVIQKVLKPDTDAEQTFFVIKHATCT